MVVVILCFTLPAIELTVWSFVCAQAIGGTALAGFATPRHELMQFAFTMAERNIVSGHMGAIARVSYLIGPATGGLMYSHVSPMAAYLFAVGWYFVALASVCASRELRSLDDRMIAEHNHGGPRRHHQGGGGGGGGIQQQRVGAAASANDDDDAGAAAGAAATAARALHVPLLQPQHGAAEDIDAPNAARDDAGAYSPVEVLAAADADADRDAGLIHVDDDAPHGHVVIASVDASAMFTVNGEVPSPAAAAPVVVSAGDHPATSGSRRTEQNTKSVLAAVIESWRIVLSIGVLALSILAIRQARRLTITFRALNLGYTPRDVGLVLAASFVIDTLFFWVSSIVVNRSGFRAAIAPMCVMYGVAFVVLSFDQTASSASLFVAVPLFGVADSFGAGIVLAVISAKCPRPVVGATRIFLDAGVMLGPLVTGVLAHTISLQRCCWVLAAWSVATALWSWFVLSAADGREAPPVPTPASPSSVAVVVAERPAVRRVSAAPAAADTEQDATSGPR